MRGEQRHVAEWSWSERQRWRRLRTKRTDGSSKEKQYWRWLNRDRAKKSWRETWMNGAEETKLKRDKMEDNWKERLSWSSQRDKQNWRLKRKTELKTAEERGRPKESWRSLICSIETEMKWESCRKELKRDKTEDSWRESIWLELNHYIIQI